MISRAVAVDDIIPFIGTGRVQITGHQSAHGINPLSRIAQEQPFQVEMELRVKQQNKYAASRAKFRKNQSRILTDNGRRMRMASTRHPVDQHITNRAHRANESRGFWVVAKLSPERPDMDINRSVDPS